MIYNVESCPPCTKAASVSRSCGNCLGTGYVTIDTGEAVRANGTPVRMGDMEGWS